MNLCLNSVPSFPNNRSINESVHTFVENMYYLYGEFGEMFTTETELIYCANKTPFTCGSI